MATVTVNAFRRALAGVGRLAATQALRLLDTLPEDYAVVTATLAEALPVLVHQHGDAAASLAADYYAEVRSSVAGLPGFDLVLADSLPDAQIAASGRWAASALRPDVDEVTPGGIHVVRQRLSAATDRLVKQTGRDTIVANVLADPSEPRWARVPTGPATCDFCLMLASRGPVYRSQDTAAAGYHDGCDCVPTPVWNKADMEALREQGYDPDELYAVWKEHESHKIIGRGPGKRRVAKQAPPPKPELPARIIDFSKPPAFNGKLDDYLTVDDADWYPPAREEAEDVLKRLAAEYPEAFSELGYFGTAQHVYAMPRRFGRPTPSVPSNVMGVTGNFRTLGMKSALGVNRNMVRSLPDYKLAIQEGIRQVERRWWPQVRPEADALRVVITHEYGHVINLHFESNPDLLSRFLDAVDDNLEKEGLPRFMRVGPDPYNTKLSFDDHVKRNRAIADVSDYAKHDSYELIAESFASWKLSDDPPAVARAIGQAIDDVTAYERKHAAD